MENLTPFEAMTFFFKVSIKPEIFIFNYYC